MSIVLDGTTGITTPEIGIGTSSPDDVLHVVTSSFGGITIECTGATADPTFKFLGDSGNYWSLQQDASQGDSFQFRYNNSEKIRLDSSGNLLVGTTDSNPVANNVSSGVQFGDGRIRASRADRAVLELNRKTSDGSIAEFRKDGTTVGSIGVQGGTDTYYAGQSTSWRIRGDIYYPADGSGNYVDNLKDIGNSNYRLDDIYATNGTIQTSDRNEKQDIEVLSDAEQRVAVACKGLLRKFRWKDAVAEKGDDARIHFGIIAQDLQDAFTAEGLDAGRYAMFISSTWTDEETGEERSRMGVRYPQLLAFIIAAI